MERSTRNRATRIPTLVVDANYNPSTSDFSQNVYRVSLQEDMPLGTSMMRLRATDLDKGIKVEIKNVFAAQSTHIQFGLDHGRGEMKTLSTSEYEEIKKYSIVLEGRNGCVWGGLVSQCS